jgi:hypothetical protein
MTLVYLHDGSLLDLATAKIIPIHVMRDLKVVNSLVYRYGVVRCGSCQLRGTSPLFKGLPSPKEIKIRIHAHSKIRRLICPACKRPTAYASRMSISPLDDDGAAAASIL